MRWCLLGILFLASCYRIGRTSYDSTSVRALVVPDSSTPDRVIAIHGDRLERSTDRGLTWTVDPTLRADAIAQSGSSIWTASGGDVSLATSASVLRSVDGGATFVSTALLPVSFTTSDPVAIAALDSQRVVVAFGSYRTSRIFATSDGGATWQTAAVSSATTSIYPVALAVDRADSRVVYLVQSGSLLRSADSGVTFATAPSPSARSQIYGVAANGSTVFAATADGLATSMDGGATWSVRVLNRVKTVRAVTLDEGDPTRVYVAIDQEGVYRSTDGGATFTLIEPNASAPLLVRGLVVYAGRTASTDGGVTFRSFGVFDFTIVLYVA